MAPSLDDLGQHKLSIIGTWPELDSGNMYPEAL